MIIKKDEKKLPRILNPNFKIKKEEDHGIEIAFSVRTLQEYQTKIKNQTNASQKLQAKKN